MNRNLLRSTSTIKREQVQGRGPSGLRRNALICLLVSALGGAALAQDTLPLVRSFHFLGPENVAGLASIPDSARWGADIAGLGDIDLDGTPEMIVGDPRHADGTGAVWMQFLTPGGSVGSTLLLGSGLNGAPSLTTGDRWGEHVAPIGDLNLDGVQDFAVLAPGDDDGGADQGALYICFAKVDGSILSYQKISATEGGFTAVFGANRKFQSDVTEVGDMNGDGVQDIAVGSSNADDGVTGGGGVWILLMNRDGTAGGQRYYAANSDWPGNGPIESGDHFGTSIAKVGDLNSDGWTDMAVSACSETPSFTQRVGLVYILLLDSTGGILSYSTMKPGQEGFFPTISDVGPHFARTITNAGDLNGDGVDDLLCSAHEQEQGEHAREGAAVVLYLEKEGVLHHWELISADAGLDSLQLGLHSNAEFGLGLASLGDLDNDHRPDLAIGCPFHNGGGTAKGRVYLLGVNPKPMVASVTIIPERMDTLGSADLIVSGGVRPYTYLWKEGFPSIEQFNNWKSAVQEYDWDSVGVPAPNLSEFTWDDLVNLTTPDVERLSSGQYTVVVVDQMGDTLIKDISVSYKMEYESAIGVITPDEGIVKNETDGWTNMAVLTRNSLGQEENGFIQFEVPQDSTRLAVGVRRSSAEQVNGYEQMEHAFIFEDGSFDLKHGNTIEELPPGASNYEPGDVFSIKFTEGRTEYQVNGQEILGVDEVDPTDSEPLVVDVAIYSEGGAVENLKTDFPTPEPPAEARGGPKIPIRVSGSAHNFTCSGVRGYIDRLSYALPMGSTAVSTTLTWNPPTVYTNGNVWEVPTPGVYTLTVDIIDQYGVAYIGTITFRIGYDVDWIERVNATTPGGQSNTLNRTTGANADGRASSSNEVDDVLSTWSMYTIGTGIPTCSLTCLNYTILSYQDLTTGVADASVFVFKLGSVLVVHAEEATNGTFHNAPANEGDLLLIETLAGGNMTVTIGTPPVSFALPNTFPNTANNPHRLSGVLTYAGATLKQTTTSFACKDPQRALMEDDLREGYHRTDRKKLLVGYWEDYNDVVLDYAIHAMDGSTVISSATQPKTAAFGYNELKFDLVASGNELAEGFYWMEITNGKGIKQYLRFFYDSSLQ